jgi:Holliday junction resolvase RusA-like endonuclease
VNTWAVAIPGKPVPKGRPRFARGRAYTPKETIDYEKRIAAAWLEKYPTLFIEPDVRIVFHVEAYSKTAGRADVDNYLKIALDGTQGIIFNNDAQVWSAKATKVKVDTPEEEFLRICVIVNDY